MSNKHDRRPRDYSKYDSMSTEQLQEILRLDAHQNVGEGMDTAELFYVMEVLTVRRKSDPKTAGKSIQEAKEEFRKHYMPKEKSHAITFPMWLRRAAAVAAVLAIFVVAATASVNAFGYDLWGKVATWSQEFFHFEDETQGTESAEPGKQDDLEYTSLQDALDKFKITESLIPAWFPDGYQLSDVSVLDSPREISISAIYKNNDKDLIVSIRRLVASKPEDIEKSDSVVLAYDANGTTYYIFNNHDRIKATWVVGEFECYIVGNVTVEEMKEMIDSI